MRGLGDSVSAFSRSDGFFEPQLSNSPIVRSLIVTQRVGLYSQSIFSEVVVEIGILSEQLSILLLLVKLSDFVADIMSKIVLKNWLLIVEFRSANQIVDPFLNPLVTQPIVFEFRRNIEAHVVSLMLPNADEVRLEQCDLIECRRKAIEILFLLVIVRLDPKN